MAFKLWGVAHQQGSCPQCRLERPYHRSGFWLHRDECPLCGADLTREAHGLHYWVIAIHLDEGEMFRVRTDQRENWTQEQRDIIEHSKWGSRIPGASSRLLLIYQVLADSERAA